VVAIFLQGFVSIIKYHGATTTIDQPPKSIAIISSNHTSSRDVATVVNKKDAPTNKRTQPEKPKGGPRINCNGRPKILDQIRVANLTNISYVPKVLCFIMTHSGCHRTKIRSIQRTWGKRCDKLVIASNQTEDSIGAVAMINTESTYLGLWEKLNETIQYIYDQYRNDGFDWIFKADDDTYVIVENLKEYLASDYVTKKMQQPQIIGRRYSSPRYRNLEKRPVYFRNPLNQDFGKRFYNKVNRNKPVIYNYGGAGYAMNWPYVEKFLEVMKGPDTLHGTPPEDQGHGVVMAYHDIWPSNTRDWLNRERFHPEPPQFMYGMSDKYRRLWNDNHQSTGGLSVGKECCSEQSISFHHVDQRRLATLDQYLYACRGLE
jgi:glycoprotein-N-acetylgalactosamine 3-beta-galactosyltransferase